MVNDYALHTAQAVQEKQIIVFQWGAIRYGWRQAEGLKKGGLTIWT